MNVNDTLSFLPFSTDFAWTFEDTVLGPKGKEQTNAAIDSLFASGQTCLYDAAKEAFSHLKRRSSENKKIQAVVLLTDGADTNSHYTLPELLKLVRFDGEGNSIRIFTIAYGHDANKEVLAQLAAATQAKSYEGTPQTIVGVFRDVSTFF